MLQNLKYSGKPLFYSLIKADSEDDVIDILNSNNLGQFDTKNWKIFGGDDFANNKALVMDKILPQKVL